MKTQFFKHSVGPFLGGILFALGLGVSGMTEPAKIIGFLDIFGDWNPTLIFVMVGAILTNAIFYRFIVKRKSPLFDTKFYLPTRKDLDKKLILGASLFGIGWGIAGLCPGPGLVSLVTGKPYAIAFVFAVVGGIVLAQFASRKNWV